MAQLCFWTKIRTKQWLVLGASAFQCMRGFLCTKCDNFAKIKISFIWKDDFFLPKSTSSVGPLSEAKTQWMVHWLQFPNQVDFVWHHTTGLYAKFVSMMSAKCQLLRTTVNWCLWRFTHTFGRIKLFSVKSDMNYFDGNCLATYFLIFYLNVGQHFLIKFNKKELLFYCLKCLNGRPILGSFWEQKLIWNSGIKNI